MSRFNYSPVLVVVALAFASMIGGCKRGAPGQAEGAPGSAVLNSGPVAATPASPGHIADRIVGKWSSEDGSEILDLTGKTMSRTYVKIKDAPKAAMPYTVGKDEGGSIELVPRIETPDGKSLKLSAQVFTLVDDDTLKGGLSGKKPTTFKRVK